MSNLDVALRIRMRYEADGARKAVADLGQVATQAQKFGGLRAEHLGRDLRDMGGAAQSAGRALADTATQAAKLSGVGVGKLEEGLKRVEAPARDATRRVEDLGRAAARFGTVSTVAILSRDLSATVAPAERARRELVAVGDAANRLGRGDGVRTLGRELAEVARHTGERVCVRLPKYRCWDVVPVLTAKGALVGIALPDRVYPRLDPAGAEEAALNPIDV